MSTPTPTYWREKFKDSHILEDANGAMLPFRPHSLLVMSDIHRGASISALPQHEAALTRQMRSFEHVVMNGDNFEMFFIDRAFYGFRHNMQDVFTTDIGNLGTMKFWKNFARGDAADMHTVVKKAIDDSVTFLEDFLKKNPQTTLHFVLGNHELIYKFRHRLDALQARYPNFEWSAESIKIGDGIFIHGDLPMADPYERLIGGLMHGELTLKQACELVRASFSKNISPLVHTTDEQRHQYGITDEERETHRLREAKSEMGWMGMLTIAMDRPGQTVINWLRSPKRCIPMLHAWLSAYDGKCDANGKPELSMSEDRIHRPFTMDGIKHVFFGHTHVKFDNLAPQAYGGLVFHNTGALTKTVMQGRGHGMLEADIRDGKLCDIRPFALENNLGLPARR